MSAQITNPQMDVLNSWKEIAQYLGRGVRTVQRWEATLGLPVRRPHGRGRSAVIAMRSDLDRWLHSCPTRNGFGNGSDPHPTGPQPENGVSVRETVTLALLLQSKQLRADVRDARLELQNSIQRLVKTLGKMTVMNRPSCLEAEIEGAGTTPYGLGRIG